MDFFQGYQIDILCLYWAPFLKQRGPIELLNVFYDSGPVCTAATLNREDFAACYFNGLSVFGKIARHTKAMQASKATPFATAADVMFTSKMIVS